MQLPPANVILSWPMPNYVNPTDVRGPSILIVTGIFFPIAVLAVALRVFTRIHLSRAFGIDDMFLLAAIVPTGACAVLTGIAVTHWGWNRHIWDVPLNMVTLGLKLTIAMECLFGVAVSCTKMSLLILTRRVMSNGTGILRHVAAAGMFVVACEGIIFNLVVIFTCSPVSDYWTLSLTPQKCINERMHLLLGGIINTLTDFLVFLLPLPTVLSLKIHRRQQILLCLLFGAGLIVCIAGTVRIWFAWKTASTYDRTWKSYPLWISSLLELDIGIICTAIPACKPFFSRYIPALLGSSFGATKDSTIPSFMGISKSGYSRSQEQRISAARPKENFYEGSSMFELQPAQVSKSGSRTNSKQLSSLPYLDAPKSSEVHHGVRISNETSVSSIVGSGDGSTPTVSITEGEPKPHADRVVAERTDSREGLVR